MKLLALVDSPDHVCCRYRIRAFEPALNAAGWSLTCQGLRQGALSRCCPVRAGGLLRFRDPPAQAVAGLATGACCAGTRVTSSSTSTTPSSSATRTTTADRTRRRRERRFAATVQAADTVIAGNDFLADCALRAGSPARAGQDHPHLHRPAPVSLQPARQEADRSATGRTDLVWIGSSSTLQGLEQQAPLWDRLGREIPGLRLRVICDRFPSFATIPVVPVPWARERDARAVRRGHRD